SLAEASNGLVLCDTDPFATSIWHERYMGKPLETLEIFAASRTYDLYIVTGDEIPFEQDGTRNGEGIRHTMHTRFIEKLETTNRKFIIVNGNKEERLKRAIQAIDNVLVR